jgi:hypothetical protein
MGDGPSSKATIGDGARRGGTLQAEQLTAVHVLPKPGERPPKEVKGPAPVLASTGDNTPPPSPAQQVNIQIGEHETNAITAAKAGDRVTAEKELTAAKTQADNSQTQANQLLTDFNRTKETERRALVTALGLDPNKATEQDIAAKLKSPSKLTAEQTERLKDLQQELHEIKALKNSPAVTRATIAFIKANGGMDAPSTASPAEQEATFERNSKEAMDLWREARRLDPNGELAKSPTFEKVDAVVNKRYQAYQIYVADQAFAANTAGDKIMLDPAQQNDPVKKAQAQAQYEAAYAATQKLDLAYISAHQDVLGAKGNTPGKLDLNDVYNLESATTSHKVIGMVEQGKYDQALPLLAKLQADVPDLPKSQVFQDVLGRIYTGGTDVDLMKHQQAFKDIFDRKDDDKLSEDDRKKKYSAALAELNAMEDIYHKRTTLLSGEMHSLQTEQAQLNQQLRDLNSKGLDPNERKFETDRLNRQLAGINSQIDFFTKGSTGKNDKGETVAVPSPVKANEINLADAAYFQGYSRYMMGDLYEANQKFHYAEDNHSVYSQPNDAFKLKELIHATDWWSRNSWLKTGLLWTGGIVAGLVTAALLSETGPGGAVAGWAVGAGIIGESSVAAVTIGVNGMLWGGLASSATGSAMRLAWGDQVTFGTAIRDFGMGAGGAAFTATRLALAPWVLAGGSRLAAGALTGTAFGVADGGANFIADVGPDHQPILPSAGRFVVNVGINAAAGALALRPSAFESGPGELALTNAWARVIPTLKGAGPVFIYPMADGTVIQLGMKGVSDYTHKPIVPVFDRTQEHHDFSQDTDVIDQEDPTVRPPRK